LVENSDRTVVVSTRRFPIDLLPIHQELDCAIALAPDIAIGLDAGPNDPLHFVRFLLDFFYRSDQTVFGIGKQLFGSGKRVEAELSPLNIEWWCYQTGGVKPLFES